MIRRSKLIQIRPLLWILLIPVLNIFYGVLNHGETTVRSLTTPLDEMIPFISAFIIPYLIWYPFIFIMLVVFFLKNIEAYYRTLLTLCLGLIASYAIFYLFQTEISRPAITESGWTNWLVHLVYLTDGPYNCFPSIHVLTSYLMMKGMSVCSHFSKVSRFLIVATSFSIIISTVFVKQHVVLDIVGAIILAEILFLIAGPFVSSQTAKKRLLIPAGNDYSRETNSSG